MSDITALLTAYDRGYTAKFGDRPRIVPGKDAKLAKDLLAIKPLETLTGYFPRYFASRDPLIVASGYTFAMFAYRINALAQGKAIPPRVEPTPEQVAGAQAFFQAQREAVEQERLAPPKPRYVPETLTEAQRLDLLAQMRATMARLAEKEMK